MASALDVDVNKLMASVAAKLKESGIVAPKFVGIVKTGAHNERPPEQPDFFYLRCASLMRQAYVRNIVGVRKLRDHYGSVKNRGVRPERHVKAGGSTIRKGFQALEKAGFMEKVEKGIKKGRKLTAKGRKLLDSCAKEVKKG
ncbi:MAG: 40S ribosomal protein S19 [Candidatus ainarchaeum sp.]|nr:40S ribosomal protein S19 [Candidatus ainarchaeum sp.]